MKILVRFFQSLLVCLRFWRLSGVAGVLIGLVSALALSWGVVQAASPVTHIVNVPAAKHVFKTDWNSVMIYKAGTGVVNNYNYANGHFHQLLSLPANSLMDGISPDGHNLLYQVTQGQQTLFYTLNEVPLQGYFFSHIDFDTSNAIWLPDSIHVLISTHRFGVAEVNTRDGSFEWLRPGKNWFGRLLFQHNGFLYFLGAGSLHAGNIYRVGLGWGLPQNFGLNIVHVNNLLLGPSGTTLYYQQTGGGPTGLFLMNSDGTHAFQLRTAGIPVGFAADNSLLFMRRVDGHEQVVKLGAGIQFDSVLVRDAAPGSQLADEAGAAMAPYGHALFVQSFNGGVSTIWSTDLETNQQFALTDVIPADAPLKLIGWDRIIEP